MPTLAIFNPEHDLCLANGCASYMPPQSALAFARSHKHYMLYVCGEDSMAVDAEGAAMVYASMVESGVAEETISIKAWGWDAVLRRNLLKHGMPEHKLPSEDYLALIRRLSHRGSCLAVQPYAVQATSLAEVEEFVGSKVDIVMKAPWSGSGWGLRWVTEHLTENDRRWVEKTLSTQGAVMVEPRFNVVQNFAVEYYADGTGSLYYKGMSLFETQNGVYRGNILLTDEEIMQRLGQWVPQFEVENDENVLSHIRSLTSEGYRGPVGIDKFVFRQADGTYCENHCVEVNFRYTMGMVACAYLKEHPECHGQTLFKSVE